MSTEPVRPSNVGTPSRPAQPRDGGVLLVFDGVVHQGAIATRGSVDPRPDARAPQDRLHCERSAAVGHARLVEPPPR